MPHKPEDNKDAAALRRVLGEQIREAREELGWSQERLAEAVGVGSAMLGRYERGSKLPSFVTFVRLSKVLKISADALLGLEQREYHRAATVVAKSAGPSLEQLTPRVREAMALVLRELTTKTGYARKVGKPAARRARKS